MRTCDYLFIALNFQPVFGYQSLRPPREAALGSMPVVPEGPGFPSLLTARNTTCSLNINDRNFCFSDSSSYCLDCGKCCSMPVVDSSSSSSSSDTELTHRSADQTPPTPPHILFKKATETQEWCCPGTAICCSGGRCCPEGGTCCGGGCCFEGEVCIDGQCAAGTTLSSSLSSNLTKSTTESSKTTSLSMSKSSSETSQFTSTSAMATGEGAGFVKVVTATFIHNRPHTTTVPTASVVPATTTSSSSSSSSSPYLTPTSIASISLASFVSLLALTSLLLFLLRRHRQSRARRTAATLPMSPTPPQSPFLSPSRTLSPLPLSYPAYPPYPTLSTPSPFSETSRPPLSQQQQPQPPTSERSQATRLPTPMPPFLTTLHATVSSRASRRAPWPPLSDNASVTSSAFSDDAAEAHIVKNDLRSLSPLSRPRASPRAIPAGPAAPRISSLYSIPSTFPTAASMMPSRPEIPSRPPYAASAATPTMDRTPSNGSNTSRPLSIFFPAPHHDAPFTPPTPSTPTPLLLHRPSSSSVGIALSYNEPIISSVPRFAPSISSYASSDILQPLTLSRWFEYQGMSWPQSSRWEAEEKKNNNTVIHRMTLEKVLLSAYAPYREPSKAFASPSTQTITPVIRPPTPTEIAELEGSAPFI